jgi:RimJ/RimL family protein N-acetyltransferase
MAEQGASIETERLSLRPIRPVDADALYAILREPAIGAAMGEEPPVDAEEVRRRIESWNRGPERQGEIWLNWIARSSDGMPVAQLAATLHGSSAWLAWIVALDAQRQGFATESGRAVMDHLVANGIDVFLASIPEGNVASEGVARKLGLHLTDETAEGERVWRLEVRSSLTPSGNRG